MDALFGPGGNSASFYAEGHKHTVEAPAWVAARGLDAYEYQAGNGITGGEENFRRVGAAAREHGVRMSLHAPYYISLSGVDPEKRLKSIDYITKSVKMTELLGGDIIVIHTGSAAKISREEAMTLARDTLEKTLESFAGTPLEHSAVRLGLETMGKQNQLGTLEEVLSLCDVDPRLAPVIDFGHLNARACGGAFPTSDDYRRVFDRVAAVLGEEYARGLHCHFSRIEYTDAGEKRHLTFADTVFGPDFEPLAEAIARDGLSPRIICESDGTMAEDARAMKDAVAQLRR